MIPNIGSGQGQYQYDPLDPVWRNPYDPRMLQGSRFTGWQGYAPRMWELFPTLNASPSVSPFPVPYATAAQAAPLPTLNTIPAQGMTGAVVPATQVPVSGMGFPVPQTGTLPQGGAKSPPRRGDTKPSAAPGESGTGGNPNEPFGIPYQYNAQALKDQKTQNLGIGGTPVGQGQGQGAGQGGYRTWIDQNGYKRSSDPKIDFAYLNIDKTVGQGFTDQFMQLHGVDPISFYMRAFTNDQRAKGFELPGAQGDQARQWLFFKSAQAAENDARFLPGAVAEWQRVHGNAEIPQEQWERWWSISQATGGYPMNVGVGENPYGVY